jgi:hypothetical protein
MIRNRMRAFTLSTAFAILGFAAPAAASPYDVSWKMVLVTTDGHCGVINIGVAINGGHISATSGKFVAHPIALNGIIYGSGQTKINGVAARARRKASVGSRASRGAANGTAPGPQACARAIGS